MSGRMICWGCRGTGVNSHGDECPDCGGYGFIEEEFDEED